ncbi:MAG: NIPSNAP family protein [Sedimentisphaerales bacterium]|nr:NIPSNAP family protein [Sedimentisphaerales bacterium]
MQRRKFLGASCMAGVVSLAGGASVARGQRMPGESEAAFRARLARMGGRTYYELRRYEIETPEQKAGFDKFLGEAAIPALNRLGIKPVGVFYPEKDLSPIYVLLPHTSLASVAMLTQKLSEDQEFLQAGAAFVDAPADKPAYKNLETQLMLAFESLPQIETPVTDPGRIFQLRTYESPSEKTRLKKIEMFNTAEIDIFRKVGLHPVFFGQTLAGTKMPNLTYMLAFKDAQEQQENWRKFGSDPEWKQLSAMPEYMDKAILRPKPASITNLILKPAGHSQI